MNDYDNLIQQAITSENIRQNYPNGIKELIDSCNLYKENEKQDNVYMYVVNKFSRWDYLKTGGVVNVNIAGFVGEPDMIGFLPVFNNYESALKYADNNPKLISQIRMKIDE